MSNFAFLRAEWPACTSAPVPPEVLSPAVPPAVHSPAGCEPATPGLGVRREGFLIFPKLVGSDVSKTRFAGLRGCG